MKAKVSKGIRTFQSAQMGRAHLSRLSISRKVFQNMIYPSLTSIVDSDTRDDSVLFSLATVAMVESEPGCKGEVRVEIGRKERNFLRGRHREIRARRSFSFRRLSTATPNSIFYRENIGVKYVHTLLLIHN